MVYNPFSHINFALISDFRQGLVDIQEARSLGQISLGGGCTEVADPALPHPAWCLLVGVSLLDQGQVGGV